MRINRVEPLRLGPAIATLLLASSCGTIQPSKDMIKIEQGWGRTPDGTAVKLFTLINSKGMTLPLKSPWARICL